jgi:5'(3')-deoxyribonucleotidase
MQKVNHHVCYYITLDWRRDQEQFIFHHVKAIVSADFPLEDNPSNLKESIQLTCLHQRTRARQIPNQIAQPSRK